MSLKNEGLGIINKKRMYQDFSEIFKKFERVGLSYIYGSFLSRDKFNDIDIGIVLIDPENSYNDWEYGNMVGRELERSIKYRIPIDIRVLNNAPNYFQFNVLKYGKLIYCKDEKFRVKHQKKVISIFLDYNDTLKWFHNQILEKI